MKKDNNSSKILGLHHVTALSSDAQKNVDFYAGILGMRMVKKTVNFDAPDVYHLYYGDYLGSPGTLMTFFPYRGLERGRKGTGQLTVTSFSIPEGSIDYWLKRLDKFGVSRSNHSKRFDEEFIYLEDDDGLGIELIVCSDDEREGFTRGNIPPEYAIRGFYGITLCEQHFERTEGFITGLLDHKPVQEENGRRRYSPNGKPGALVDVVADGSGTGRQGSGSVHHVAFATHDDASQLEIREKLIEMRVHVTPVIDRQYFHSIYFREPGGVLFEVATLPPGMDIDEDAARLGESLKLAPWHESKREQIEKNLEPVSLDIDKFRD